FETNPKIPKTPETFQGFQLFIQSNQTVGILRTRTNLVFTNNAFTPIMNSPFSFALRDRIIRLLDILNQLSGEMDIQTGALSPNGEALRKTFFEGKNALFTDSSDTEKAAFKTALSFRCPISEDLQLFPWHGKTRANGQYRVHFGWPKPAPSDGLPVVYIGPKITKQ
ncbi:MAG: hypothetical protein OXI17_10125, partial [Gammaproteobacteria bacterium]|nr:hypothetical protein [Gammaproteobacteria bacterium]